MLLSAPRFASSHFLDSFHCGMSASRDLDDGSEDHFAHYWEGGGGGGG
jgi:hypothetical protein